MSYPSKIRRYLEKSPELKRWSLVTQSDKKIDQIVVIPALAEKNHLFKALYSLSKNPAEDLESTLIVCVVNNRASGFASEDEIENNQITLTCLKYLLNGGSLSACPIGPEIMQEIEEIRESKLRVAYVDASSSGFELPERGGVGMARKIGMDIGLGAFDYSSPGEKLLISLDADTLVEPNYLSEVRRYFAGKGVHGAVVSFSHRMPDNGKHNSAICAYELFLRYYVAGLHYAGSPYAFHTIGSTMVCTASAYVAVGGMNRRRAAEDFYFLQKLAKYRGIGEIRGTIVYPSARASGRVPFGTGRKISEMIENGEKEFPFYSPEIFRVLRGFLQMMGASVALSGKDTLKRSHDIESLLADYLSESGFDVVWERLKKNSPDNDRLLRQFHGWFDGFRTLKLVHHLRDNGYESVDMFSAIKRLMEMAGRPIDALAESSL